MVILQIRGDIDARHIRNGDHDIGADMKKSRCTTISLYSCSS